MPRGPPPVLSGPSPVRLPQDLQETSGTAPRGPGAGTDGDGLMRAPASPSQLGHLALDFGKAAVLG